MICSLFIVHIRFRTNNRVLLFFRITWSKYCYWYWSFVKTFCPQSNTTQIFEVKVIFVYNGIRLQRERSLLGYLRTRKTVEWKQLEFCPFGRVLFIAESISRTARVLSTVPGNIDASCMYSSSDLFIAYRPRGGGWAGSIQDFAPHPLMHYFGFASPRRAVATAADIELLQWLATNISNLNNEFMGRLGRFLLH